MPRLHDSDVIRSNGVALVDELAQSVERGDVEAYDRALSVLDGWVARMRRDLVIGDVDPLAYYTALAAERRAEVGGCRRVTTGPQTTPHSR